MKVRITLFTVLMLTFGLNSANAQSIFWSEDFSDGDLPAGWTSEDASGGDAGVSPQVARRPMAYNDFAWGVTVNDNTVDANYHNYTCSKCHNPHASRLPRLMITNCLDVVHNTWDNQYTGDGNWGNWNGYTYNNNHEFAYSSTAQNCHRYVDVAGGGVEEPGWNSVTPW